MYMLPLIASSELDKLGNSVQAGEWSACVVDYSEKVIICKML